MTASEAIKILKKDSCYECAQGTDSPFNCEYGGCRVAKATRVAIQALEEVQQYRAIGTPEELQAVMEKQIAKKPTYEGDGYAPDGTLVYDTWICPCCDKRYEVDYDDYDYCPSCGQKLDWSDEE